MEHQPRVAVLGPCDVRLPPDEHDDDVAAPQLSAVQRKILARLALSRPASVGLDELTETIWGDSPPATATTSIHNQISRIRHRLGSEVIETSGGRYALTAPTDVEAVSEQLEAAEHEVAQSRHAAVVEIARSALALWRGTPYDELDEVDGVGSERHRLAETRRSLETLLLEASIGANRLAWAIPESERLVAQTPDDEHRWVLLIRALELAGRRGDALGAYERARRSLAERVGLEPSEALRAAEASVLGARDTTRSTSSVPLIGRERLIAQAMSSCELGSAVLLVGEPGMGKSRVLAELRRRLRRRGATVAVTEAPLYADTAVATLRELVDELGVALEMLHAPVDAFVLAIGRAVGASGQVALMVDDLDRVGPTTLEALRAASELDGVVLVATATDAGSLSAGAWGALLTLDPLDAAESAEFAAEVVDDGTEIDGGELAWLIEMSGGNPAFLEHLVDDPVRLERGAAAWSDGSERPLGSTGLRDVVRMRLERVGSTARAALEVAAVGGPRCPAAVLAELTAGDGLAAGLATSLLSEFESDDGERWIRFRHEAVQRVLYEDLPPGRRMEIHHRAASVLRASGAPVSVVARHSAASAEVDPLGATHDAVAAARLAGSQGAHADAALWYSRAISSVDKTGADGRLRVDVLVGHGDALRRAGSPDQEEALFAAAAAAFELGDEDLIAEAAFAVLQLGATTESGRVHGRAIDLAEVALSQVVDPDARALIAGGASLVHSMSDSSALCRELFLQAEAGAASSVVRRNVLPFAYLGIGHPADLELRERITAELFTLSDEAADSIARFEALQLAFSVALQRCDGVGARSAVEESAGLIEQIGDVGRRWSLAYQQAAIAHLDGDLERAESHAEQSLEMFGAVSPSRAFAAYGAQLLAVRMAQGRVGELAATIEHLLAEQPGVPAWNAALALALALDDPDRADRHAAAALDDVTEDFTWLAAHVIGGRAAAIIGTGPTRERYAERLAPHSGLGCWQGTCCYGPVDTVLWQLHRSLGNGERARRHLEIAAQSANRLRAPVFLAELGLSDTAGAA